MIKKVVRYFRKRNDMRLRKWCMKLVVCRPQIGGNIEPQVQAFLEQHNSTLLKSGMTLEELLKRPEICYNDLKEIDTKQPELPEAVTQQVEISIKYEGYIKRQLQQVEQFKKLEKKKLSLDFDYSQVPNLRKEAIQKLNEYQPASIGQASRISGVSPADVSVLLVYLNR